MNGVKKVDDTEVPLDMEELITAEEGPKEDVATPEAKTTDDQDGELDFEAYVLNSIMNIFYDDYDVSLIPLFEADGLFYSKMNAMKSDFAYLCDVFPNGYSIYDDHFMHLFDVNYMQTESFNFTTIDNPKNILLASNLTHDEKEKMKETLKKR